MSEIICLTVGQCGNRIGAKFWETIANEHGIDSTGRYVGNNDEQREKLGVFFKEAGGGRYVPRSVLIDLEPDTLDAVRASRWGKFYQQENFVVGQNSAGKNWAKGHSTVGPEHLDHVLERVRKEVEDTDNLQGFFVFHSLGGGTGSGMGSLLIKTLREEFPGKVIATFSVWPSAKISTSIVEPYNTTLSSHVLTEYADLCFVLDNEALYDICFNTLRIATPTYEDLNHLIAVAASRATVPLRFPTNESGVSTLQEMVASLIPFPRLHFLSIGLAPLTSPGATGSRSLLPEALVQGIFSSDHTLTQGEPKHGKYLAAHAVFRGRIDPKELDKQMGNSIARISSNLPSWIPNGVKWSHYNWREGQEATGALLTNSTTNQEIFKRIAEQFSSMFKRKSFLHWYTGEGMDEMEFTEAERNMNALISDYQRYQDAEE